MRKLLSLFLAASLLAGCSSTKGVVLNDVHSRLNPTRVAEVHTPRSTGELSALVKEAKRKGLAVSISGGRHAMGGQQFGEGTLHLDMTQMNRILDFDREKGILRAEAGAQWPELVAYLLKAQKDEWPQWGITQKQTGADRLTLGGGLSANIHGRGANLKPFIQDIEAFTLVNAEGEVLDVSRTQNAELFKLVIGGYGLFGVIATVDLRLSRRKKMQRVVEVLPIEELPAKAKSRIADGFLYGDFQYKTDEQAADFMKVGVFSTYKPVPDETEMSPVKQRLTPDSWREYLRLAHVDKAKAFEFYKNYYLTTNGNHYWSDTHQTSFYDDQYIEFLQQALPKDYPAGSLMITEIYVPRTRLTEFINKVSTEARKHDFNIIYGTMRLIEKDDESFLAWAKQNYAAVIFNLRVDHSEAGKEKAAENFRRLIDLGLSFGGSYFLTYHRWAEKKQLLAAYPQFPEFLRLKKKYDPEERFQSEWYRHYKKMFAAELA